MNTLRGSDPDGGVGSGGVRACVGLHYKAAVAPDPAPSEGAGASDERPSRLGAKSKMQSAVTNGAASRAHRF